ncbi:MAG: hypothetical protein LBQ94_11550 [Treponema sp.]|jgi:uncharacterized membrane protein|nr:hypothetical protein [Treponema sp.]
MDSGQIVYILGRLVLGATASFLAIMLWSRIRDAAWILVIIGTIVAYVETVYSILILMGIANEYIMLGSMSLLSIILPCLSTLFFIAAFAVMVARKYRRR